jgi:hypothetical protein
MGTSAAMSDSSDRDMEHADIANGEGDPDQLKRPPTDPEAPGTGVDDDDPVDVPEPNEPA